MYAISLRKLVEDVVKMWCREGKPGQADGMGPLSVSVMRRGEGAWVDGFEREAVLVMRAPLALALTLALFLL